MTALFSQLHGTTMNGKNNTDLLKDKWYLHMVFKNAPFSCMMVHHAIAQILLLNEDKENSNPGLH